MIRAGIGVAVLFALASLAGCGSSGPIKLDRFFRLDPAALEGPAGAPVPAILMVNDLAARGFLGSRAIPFRTREDPLVAQRYDDLLWEEPPARALARALVTALRAARVFAFVVVAAERARADYLLAVSWSALSICRPISRRGWRQLSISPWYGRRIAALSRLGNTAARSRSMPTRRTP